MKDLNSSDGGVQQKALKAANGYITASDERCRTKVNKTTINTKPPAPACQVNICTQSHPVQHKSIFLSVLPSTRLTPPTNSCVMAFLA